MNPIKFWEVIKDDSRKTYEVIGQESNTNFFTNQTYGMQKSGMNVTGLTLPVGGKFSSKDSVKFVGYHHETGLYERLLAEYRKKNSFPEDWEET